MASDTMNRKQRKELARRLQSANPGLEVVHSRAAGIDIGNTAHYVAVRPDQDPEPVRRFECFTADLHRLADWLEACGVATIAMQSTGVYWIPLYEILEERGFEVYLVNARHTKNLPGRKSDVQESQWLLKLHTYGLLNNSFQPAAEIRVARTYWRQRGEHVHGASTCIQRMQKVLTQMNLQLANVISDVSGLTGQRIVRAILAGERNPKNLAELSDYRIRASREPSRQEPRRQLAAGTAVCAEARDGNVRHLPTPHRRMRPRIRSTPQELCRQSWAKTYRGGTALGTRAREEGADHEADPGWQESPRQSAAV
jgi:transposase